MRRLAFIALVVDAVAVTAAVSLVGVAVGCAKADPPQDVDAGGDGIDASDLPVDAPPCDDVWYADTDGDGHGDPAARVLACTAPTGHVALGDDCDDTQALVFPGGVEVCDGLDNDCASATTEVCSSGCVVRVRPDDNRRYLFCAIASTFAVAQTRCTTEQFRLWRADDQAENTYVRTTATAAVGSVSLWLGASDTAAEGAWRWPDGAQFWQGGSGGTAIGGLYENWNSGEPNNDNNEDCAELRTDSSWNDRECGTALQFVCERY